LGLAFLWRVFWCRVGSSSLAFVVRGICLGFLAALEMTAARGKRQCAAAVWAKNVTQKRQQKGGAGGMYFACQIRII